MSDTTFSLKHTPSEKYWFPKTISRSSTRKHSGISEKSIPYYSPTIPGTAIAASASIPWFLQQQIHRHFSQQMCGSTRIALQALGWNAVRIHCLQTSNRTNIPERRWKSNIKMSHQWFNTAGYRVDFYQSIHYVKQPENFDSLLAGGESLSVSGIVHVRVDLDWSGKYRSRCLQLRSEKSRKQGICFV